MTLSPPTIPAEEQEQVLQTIEMFEVITQANPQDTQSLEILKDAYQRIGKDDEALKIGRKLAEIYVEMGQYSAAMLEYEAILQKLPGNKEIATALEDVQLLLAKRGSAAPSAIDVDFRGAVADTGTLMATEQTLRVDGPAMRNEAMRKSIEAKLDGQPDGNEALAKFLIQNKIVPEEIASSALERVQKKNHGLAANTMAISLIDEICRRGAIELDAMLCGILDRAKFAYIPLESYDVDRSIVKMLPEKLTLGRLIVPFDVISRTIMVAMANPFDSVGKEAVQQFLDYTVQWHIAQPKAIFQVLGETYRIAL